MRTTVTLDDDVYAAAMHLASESGESVGKGLSKLARWNRWATCALTQLGFIRLSSSPAVVPRARRPAEAAALLSAMVQDRLHVFLEALPSPMGAGFRRGF
ncbi:MAG: hypothetical protein ABSF54_10200 [Bryobacteraceae bacterium]|jgi:uncharacterized protein